MPRDRHDHHHHPHHLDEIRILKTQTQRLTTKLDVATNELVETQVFLRSERKRNKNLFEEVKLKEDHIDDLKQQIGDLEEEIEGKDRKLEDIMERLTVAEQQNKTLIETLAMNRDLDSKLTRSRHEVQEWQSKHRQIAEEYATAKQVHQREMDRVHEELEQTEQAQRQHVVELNELIDAQNDDMDSIKRRHQRVLASMDRIWRITEIVQYHIQSNGEETVSRHLRAMLSSDGNDGITDDQDQHQEDEAEGDEVDINRNMEVLVRSLIAVIDEANTLRLHNEEMTEILEKYENEQDAAKRNLSEIERKCNNQQDRIARLQSNYGRLNEEKARIEAESGGIAQELRELHGTLHSATDRLQNVVVEFTEFGVVGADVDIDKCIQLIHDAMSKHQTELQKLRTMVDRVAIQHQTQMDTMDTIFRKAHSNWSLKVHRLQDMLSNAQIAFLRKNGTDASFTSNLSNMSMVSDVNRSFRIDDLNEQYNEQLALINGLKAEIKAKQETIDSVTSNSDGVRIQKCKIENLEATVTDLQDELQEAIAEKENAVHDFQRIAQEWQAVENNIDDVCSSRMALEAELENIETWIGRIVEFARNRIDGNDCQLQLDIARDDIPRSLKKLHEALSDMVTRMHLSDLNETTCEDINDDMVLEQIFGKIPENEPKSEVDDKEMLRQQIELEDTRRAREALKSSVAELEAKVCLEQILHKVELSHVGNEAETLIAAYQQRLKTYHSFIQQLQAKQADAVKMIHAVTLERDHSFSQQRKAQEQIQVLTKEIEQRVHQNEALDIEMKSCQRQNEQLREQTSTALRGAELKKRQLIMIEQNNIAMQQRLHESTLLMEQTANQRDEWKRKYVEFEATSSMLFQRALSSVADSFTPLMDNMDQYAMVSDRVDGLSQKIRFLKDHMTRSRVNAEQEKREAVEQAVLEHGKRALSKARMHADIHRFKYAKFVEEMKQSHAMQIEQLQAQIRSAQSELSTSQRMCYSLKEALDGKEEEKVVVESQLMRLKKSFNEEVVNYQNVQNENKENQRKLSAMVHALKQQLEERKHYALSVETQIADSNRQRDELQSELVDQRNKSQKLHAKSHRLQSEVTAMQTKYGKIGKEVEELVAENEDQKTQIQQLKSLNLSLGEALSSKDANEQRMAAIHSSEITKLRAALSEVEATNHELSAKSEGHRGEMSKLEEQLRRSESTNTDLMEKIHSMQSDKLHEGRQWFDKEEDLRNEINVIRQQLHEATNDLGVFQFELLEKETLIKKLQNEASGLREQMLFHKEREQKEKEERALLVEQLSSHDAIHENKVNDIKMILDAKSVRIIRLQEELQDKEDAVKRMETEVVGLRSEVATARSLIDRKEQRNRVLEGQNTEIEKLKDIIADINGQLDAVAKENGTLRSELKTQKNANVQLSAELDSIKGVRTKTQRDELELSGTLSLYSSPAFYDRDLESNGEHIEHREEMVSLQTHNDDREREETANGSDEDVLRTLNIQSVLREDAETTSVSNEQCDPKKATKRRRRGPGLPLPTTGAPAI